MVDGKKLFLNLEVTVLRLLYLSNGSGEMSDQSGEWGSWRLAAVLRECFLQIPLKSGTMMDRAMSASLCSLLHSWAFEFPTQTCGDILLPLPEVNNQLLGFANVEPDHWYHSTCDRSPSHTPTLCYLSNINEMMGEFKDCVAGRTQDWDTRPPWGPPALLDSVVVANPLWWRSINEEIEDPVA